MRGDLPGTVSSAITHGRTILLSSQPSSTASTPRADSHGAATPLLLRLLIR